LGEFRFAAAGEGRYTLEVEVEGYRPALEPVLLTSGKPSQLVRIELSRGGVVSGRVVDAETRQPVVKRRLSITNAEYSKGTYTGMWRAVVETDAEGRFEASVAEPEPLMVLLWPSFWADEEPNRTQFTAADIEAVDEEYTVTYWPGGGTFETALPIMPTGVPLDVGTIRLRKMAYRRALVRSPEGCKPGDKYEGWLHAMGVDRTFRSVVNIACGQDVLLRGLIPGETYRFRVQPYTQPPSTGRRTAEMFFTASDRNLELKPVLRQASDLEIHVRMPEENVPRPATLQVNGKALDAQGRLRVEALPVGDFLLRITGLGQHVIRAIQLAGQPLLAQETQTVPWAGAGPLEITLEDKPASLTVVTPVDTAIIVFRWPAPSSRDSLFEARIEARRNVAQRLTAGEYRVLAVKDIDRARLEDPGVLERLLPRAKTVTLTRGAAVTLEVETIDPSR
jgi:hypothetical protein